MIKDIFCVFFFFQKKKQKQNCMKHRREARQPRGRLCFRYLLSSAVVTVGELGGEWHVELIVRDVTEAAAGWCGLLKPGKKKKKSLNAIRDSIFLGYNRDLQ